MNNAEIYENLEIKLVGESIQDCIWHIKRANQKLKEHSTDHHLYTIGLNIFQKKLIEDKIKLKELNEKQKLKI